MLVKAGAETGVKNAMGRTAVWEAEVNGKEELAGWLLGVGGLETGGGTEGVAREEEEEEVEGNEENEGKGEEGKGEAVNGEGGVEVVEKGLEDVKIGGEEKEEKV
jgi:hypothetical protein